MTWRNFTGKENAIPDSADCLTNYGFSAIQFRGINEAGTKLNASQQWFHAAAILPCAERKFGNLHSGVTKFL
jgi:hypothetical protein